MSAKKIVDVGRLPLFQISATLVTISLAFPMGCEYKRSALQDQSSNRLKVEAAPIENSKDMNLVETTLDEFFDILLDRIKSNGVEAETIDENGAFRSFLITVPSKEPDNENYISIVTANFDELNLTCNKMFSLTVPSIAANSSSGIRNLSGNDWAISANGNSDRAASIDAGTNSIREPGRERFLEFSLSKKR